MAKGRGLLQKCNKNLIKLVSELSIAHGWLSLENFNKRELELVLPEQALLIY